MTNYRSSEKYDILAGIHAEIAKARYEYWSSFAPQPVEVVLAAGQKAKEEGGKILYLYISFI